MRSRKRRVSAELSPAIVVVSVHAPPWMNPQQKASYAALVKRRAKQFAEEMRQLGEERPSDRS